MSWFLTDHDMYPVFYKLQMAATGSTAPALPIKDRVGDLDLVAERSDTIYFRGIGARYIADEVVEEVLSIIEAPLEMDSSERRSMGSGTVWAKYRNADVATRTIAKLHKLQFQGYFKGYGLMTSFELGADKADWDEKLQRRKPNIQYNPVLRRVCDVKGTQNDQLVSYAKWCADREKNRKGISAINPADNTFDNQKPDNAGKKLRKQLKKKAIERAQMEKEAPAAGEKEVPTGEAANDEASEVAKHPEVVAAGEAGGAGEGDPRDLDEDKAVVMMREPPSKYKPRRETSWCLKWGYHPIDETIPEEVLDEELKKEEVELPVDHPSRTAGKAEKEEETEESQAPVVEEPAKDIKETPLPATPDVPRPQVQYPSTSKKNKAPQGKSGENAPAKGKRLVKNPNVMVHNVHDVQYNQRYMIINKKTQYPFPSGVYLSRVIRAMHSMSPKEDPLMWLLSNVEEVGGLKNYDKEISEVMSMVDGTERAIRLTLGQSLKPLTNTNVFVVGDGKYPLCASALALFVPHSESWSFFSIDPIMETAEMESRIGNGRFDASSEKVMSDGEKYAKRFFQYKLMSQDFDMPAELKKAGIANWEHYDIVDQCVEIAPDSDEKSKPVNVAEVKSRDDLTAITGNLSVVVACHSHAPLKEFWDRVPSPKICVTLPCCENFADKPKKPNHVVFFHRSRRVSGVLKRISAAPRTSSTTISKSSPPSAGSNSTEISKPT